MSEETEKPIREEISEKLIANGYWDNEYNVSRIYNTYINTYVKDINEIIDFYGKRVLDRIQQPLSMETGKHNPKATTYGQPKSEQSVKQEILHVMKAMGIETYSDWVGQILFKCMKSLEKSIFDVITEWKRDGGTKEIINTKGNSTSTNPNPNSDLHDKQTSSTIGIKGNYTIPTDQPNSLKERCISYASSLPNKTVSELLENADKIMGVIQGSL